jgi:hypothetical protein
MTEPTRNDPELLNSGTGGGLLHFFDIMIKKNEVNKSTGGALRTASRKYLELEEDPDNVDLRSIQFEALNRRFVNRYRGELNGKSLETYAYRFRTATEMYINFLDDKEWNTIKTRVGSGGKSRTNGTKSAVRTESAMADEPIVETTVQPPPAGMIEFPIPLRPGVTGRLILPDDLTQKEAKRVVAVVTALAIEEQLSITAGPLQN